MKRHVAAAALFIVFAAALPAGAKVLPVAQLDVGEAAFWNGPGVDRSVGSSYFATGDYRCGENIECFDYGIEVESAGATLRVALDSIDLDDYYYVRLFNPANTQVAAIRPLYSGEVYTYASAGMWRVRVEARRVVDGRFRMRAKLEVPKVGITEGPRRALLPNLRLLPPFKFTFLSPAYTPAGYSSGCTEDEIAEHLPQRCLRFSLGPANYGDGPLELFYEQLEGVGQRGTIYQTIHYTDGSTSQREAGEFEYHTAHGHFHHAGFGSLELFRVKDPKSGEMVRAGEGPKQGFCMAPYLIVAWRSFDNDRAHSAEANCLEMTPATGSHMGLDRGWADIYEWYLSGNYVDFGNNTDGLYVVRSMTDAGRDIRETNEKDNWSYAYIEVSSDDISVLERGYGRSPWDPNKILEPNWLMPTVP